MTVTSLTLVNLATVLRQFLAISTERLPKYRQQLTMPLLTFMQLIVTKLLREKLIRKGDFIGGLPHSSYNEGLSHSTWSVPTLNIGIFIFLTNTTFGSMRRYSGRKENGLLNICLPRRLTMRQRKPILLSLKLRLVMRGN